VVSPTSSTALEAPSANVSCRAYVPKDFPKYHTGHTINLCGQIAVLVLACGGIAYCKWENKQRDLGKRDHRLNASESQVKDLGYRHPEFRLIT
jgi:hypothetical protein